MALSKDFNDNCHELQTLRWFRDNCVPKEDIVHYYRIAPQIVSVIDQRPNSVEIYRNIYDKVVKTCVSAIETMNYKLAFETYREAVIELENIYLPKR